jgi:hypothetical protein
VSLDELREVLKKASKEYSHFEEHAQFLESKNNRCVQSSQRAHNTRPDCSRLVRGSQAIMQRLVPLASQQRL